MGCRLKVLLRNAWKEAGCHIKSTLKCLVLLKPFLILAIFMLVYALGAGSFVHASDPGWKMVSAPLVSPQEARQIMKDLAVEPLGGAGDPLQIEITPEIRELARSLQDDPKLIYEFVRNHIDYVPYYGALKGAALTLVERSGNDFDQATLMIALLRESGYSARYVYGEMTIPNHGAADDYDMKHWLGVDANSSVIGQVLANGGIPATVYSSYTYLHRVWVKATIDEGDYLFDPAFKPWQEIAGLDIASAMGYDKAELLSAVGGEVGTDYVQNLNESGLNAKLTQYATNLIDFIRANYPNAGVEEIIGGRKIIPEYLEEYPTDLRFPYTVVAHWDNVPDEYVHKVRIEHGGIDEEFHIAEIAGKRLSITYETGTMGSSGSGSETIPPENKIPLSLAGKIQIKAANPVNPRAPGVESKVVPEMEKMSPRLDRGAEEEGSVRDGTWDFGRIYPNGYVQGDYQVTNTNSVTVQIYVSLSSNPSGAYSIQSGGGSHSLAPGQSHTVAVRLSSDGQSPGTKTGELRIQWYHQGSQFADNRTNLTGIIAHDPEISGAGLNFGQTYLEEPREGTCWIQNDSEESLSLTIDSISIQGSDQNRFEILSGAGTGVLSPGQRRDIEVSYLSDVVGDHDDAHVLIELTYDGLHYHGDGGVKLSLSGETLPLPNAKLWLDDDLIAQGDSSGAMILSIDHPYPDEGGTYGDQSAEYKMKPGDSTYVIISDFGGSKAGLLLKKRQKIMEEYRASGLPDDSREVLTETLNVMGQTWMEETTLNVNMLSELWDVISIRHHRFGVVAQERGYYIDVKAQAGASISRHGNDLDEHACFRASNFLMSAMEHGVLEQLQIDVPAASTVKLFQIANSQGHKIFMANADNYSTIEDQLTGYSSQDFQGFHDKVYNDGATLFLPAEGQLTSAGWEWKGKGYIEYSETETTAHVGMIIGGDYYGGYAVLDAFADAAQLVKNKTVKLWNDVTSIFDRKSKDPINMTTGAATSENTDLSMGGGEPLGLHLTRFYTSDSHYKKTVLGHGWNHNYNVYADVHSDGESGLGSRLPVDCAALIAASVSTLDLMETDPQVREWTISSLIGKWAMDRLSYNAVSVYLRKMALTYIKLPDDTYNPPPGVTMELIKDGSLY